MMKFSERRARAKETAQEAAREATRKHLAAAIEGVAAAALDALHAYEAGAITPEQDVAFGALLTKLRTELAPIAEPIDTARQILNELERERADYAHLHKS